MNVTPAGIPQAAAPSARRAMAALFALVLLAVSVPPAGASGPRRMDSPPPLPGTESMDVGDWLSWHKGLAAGRALAAARPMTLNQDAWDARHYDLDLRVTPATQTLAATVRATGTVVAGPLAEVELDFTNALTVDSVLCAGAPAPHVLAPDLLTITLDRPYANGETFEVVVHYHGTPPLNGLGSFVFTTRSGQPMVWTLSEPYGARSWWPCKDQPADKADSVDVRVTTPAGMITASNGSLLDTVHDAGLTTMHWRERHPIATYLVSIASHPYSTYSDWFHHAPGDSMEIQFFMFPDHVATYSAVNAKVKDMLAAFTPWFGPYPFLDEKYGHAEFTWGGGMEHQTCTSLGAFPEYIVAHELAHQWWGDLVTCRDFHHIWVNEGLATYGEALWAEAKSGFAAYKQDLAYNRYFGAGTIHVADATDIGQIFSKNLSYNKGSWVPHMLRGVLGDATFFAGLQHYGDQMAYASATTEDFRDAFEAVSGRDLDAFFQQWIYGEYYPQYRVTHVSEPAAGGWDVHVQIQQTQTWQLFWMPIEVRIQTTGGTHSFTAWDSLAVQTFTFHVPDAPVSVAIDPDEWILRTVTYPVAVEDAPGAAARFALAPPAPNPSRDGTLVEFTLPRAGDARVAIHDASGRLVAEPFRGALRAGTHHSAWNGRDARGQAVGDGMYWVSVEHEGQRRTRKLVVVR